MALAPTSIQISLPNGNSPPVLKLTDFGVTRLSPNTNPLPVWEKFGCDLAFTAPEMYEFIWTYSLPVDVFSLGCVWAV